MSDGSSVDIAVDIPEQLPPVVADEDRLIQVLFNLLGNALKFTERGRVILSARDMGDRIKILVEDTGIGMTKEQQEKLFRALVFVSEHGNNAVDAFEAGALDYLLKPVTGTRLQKTLWFIVDFVCTERIG